MKGSSNCGTWRDRVTNDKKQETMTLCKEDQWKDIFLVDLSWGCWIRLCLLSIEYELWLKKAPWWKYCELLKQYHADFLGVQTPWGWRYDWTPKTCPKHRSPQEVWLVFRFFCLQSSCSEGQTPHHRLSQPNLNRNLRVSWRIIPGLGYVGTVDGWNPANQLIGSLSHYL